MHRLRRVRAGGPGRSYLSRYPTRSRELAQAECGIRLCLAEHRDQAPRTRGRKGFRWRCRKTSILFTRSRPRRLAIARQVQFLPLATRLDVTSDLYNDGASKTVLVGVISPNRLMRIARCR